MTLNESLATKIRTMLESCAVHPNFVPMSDDGTFEHLPAVSYRLISGQRYTAGDVGNTGFGQFQYMLEVFDQDATVCEQLRKRLEDGFPGPIGSGEQSVPERWGPASDPGPWIYQATASDPESDGTVPQTDAHLTLHYEQILVSITSQE